RMVDRRRLLLALTSGLAVTGLGTSKALAVLASERTAAMPSLKVLCEELSAAIDKRWTMREPLLWIRRNRPPPTDAQVAAHKQAYSDMIVAAERFMARPSDDKDDVLLKYGMLEELLYEMPDGESYAGIRRFNRWLYEI